MVVSLVQVEAGRRVVSKEQFPLELRVDLYLATDQGVPGWEPSASILQFKLQFSGNIM